MTSKISAPLYSLLATLPSPQGAPDYLIRLDSRLSWREAELSLLYVPDRHILTDEAWQAYAEALGKESWTTFEALALGVLNDVNNELVPRWLRVSVFSAPGVSDAGHGARHGVMVEDHQPLWKNFDLVGRLSEISGPR